MKPANFDWSTATQDDVDDGPLTEYNEGFIAFMFGHFLHENPYNGSCPEPEDTRYFIFVGGWQDAKKEYPELEPKEN